MNDLEEELRQAQLRTLAARQAVFEAMLGGIDDETDLDNNLLLDEFEDAIVEESMLGGVAVERESAAGGTTAP